MSRWWVSFWSGYYESEGCTKPPFQVWISGSRDRKGDGDEVSLCAVIDANGPDEIWPVVKRHFPDYEERFCQATEPDWRPGDRFPGFEGRTSLIAKVT